MHVVLYLINYKSWQFLVKAFTFYVKYVKIKDVEYVLSDEHTRYYFQITIGLEQKHI